uniref:Uncharacterized protein n=1 Tax=Toxoplasma gondii TgCATBr9 TaxID=943120 RepID=A0A2T6IHB7_TOXGO|nr:hypothetical protein TGBR9_364950 [Toxoplasma gondii TgCATBr9]
MIKWDFQVSVETEFFSARRSFDPDLLPTSWSSRGLLSGLCGRSVGKFRAETAEFSIRCALVICCVNKRIELEVRTTVTKRSPRSREVHGVCFSQSSECSALLKKGKERHKITRICKKRHIRAEPLVQLRVHAASIECRCKLATETQKILLLTVRQAEQRRSFFTTLRSILYRTKRLYGNSQKAPNLRDYLKVHELIRCSNAAFSKANNVVMENCSCENVVFPDKIVSVLFLLLGVTATKLSSCGREVTLIHAFFGLPQLNTGNASTRSKVTVSSRSSPFNVRLFFLIQCLFHPDELRRGKHRITASVPLSIVYPSCFTHRHHGLQCAVQR